MPTDTATRTGAIIDWLTANPGYHSPADIADGIGERTPPVASALLYLARNERVLRRRGKVANGPGSSKYAARRKRSKK